MKDPIPFRSLLTVLVLVLGSLSGHAQTVGWVIPATSTGVEGNAIQLVIQRDSISTKDTVYVSIFSGASDRIESFSDTVIFQIEDSLASCSVVTIENTVCGDTEGVTLRIDSTTVNSINTDAQIHTLTIQDNDMAQASITVTDTAVCGSDPVQLVADSLRPGWTGIWSVVTTDFEGTFLPPDSSSTSFTPMDFGSVTLRWTILNNACSNSDEVEVSFVAEQVANAGGDITFCSSDAMIPLGANGPITGWTGEWSSTESGVLFSNSSSANSTFSYSGTASSTVLTWILTDTSNTCPPSSDTVEVSFVQPPSATISPNTAELCQGDSITLNGNAADPGQSGIWNVNGGGDDGWFRNVEDPNTLFLPDSSGSFQLTWTVSDDSGQCAAASATFDLVVFHRPFAGMDGELSLCGDDDPVVLFGLLVGADAGGQWTDNFIGTYDPDSLGSGTFRYRVPGNSACLADTALVEVFEGEPPTPLGPDDILSLEGNVFCSGQYTLVSVITTEPNIQYTWYCQGCAETEIMGDAVEFHWGDGPGPWSYWVTAHIGTCSSQSDPFPVTVGVGEASCPRGIVFFEPHGLAVLDPMADQFQWGSINEAGAFEATLGATQQTIFDPANINGCLPYYAARTRSGSGCWTTTTTCVDDTPLRECSRSGMILDHEDREVGVSPNPVEDGFIRVVLSGVSKDEPITVEMYHANGQLAYRQAYLATSQLVIDPGTLFLPTGLYLLRVNGNDWSKTVKLTIN